MNELPKALLFDVDGTLADTERDGHRVAYNRTFEEFGLDWFWSVEEYGELLAVTGGKERMTFYLERHGRDVDSDLIRRVYARKSEIFQAMLSGGEIQLRPGVKRLLLSARASGVRLAVATTTHPGNVTHLLSSTLGKDAVDWFEVIAAGDCVPAKKPAPDIYQYALDKMGLNAEGCVAFEDSHNGVLSAQGAGLPVVVTPTDYTADEDFSTAALVINQLGEEESPFEVILNRCALDSLQGMVDLPLLAEIAVACR